MGDPKLGYTMVTDLTTEFLVAIAQRTVDLLMR